MGLENKGSPDRLVSADFLQAVVQSFNAISAGAFEGLGIAELLEPLVLDRSARGFGDCLQTQARSLSLKE